MKDQSTTTMSFRELLFTFYLPFTSTCSHETKDSTLSHTFVKISVGYGPRESPAVPSPHSPNITKSILHTVWRIMYLSISKVSGIGIASWMIGILASQGIVALRLRCPWHIAIVRSRLHSEELWPKLLVLEWTCPFRPSGVVRHIIPPMPRIRTGDCEYIWTFTCQAIFEPSPVAIAFAIFGADEIVLICLSIRTPPCARMAVWHEWIALAHAFHRSEPLPFIWVVFSPAEMVVGNTDAGHAAGIAVERRPVWRKPLSHCGSVTARCWLTIGLLPARREKFGKDESCTILRAWNESVLCWRCCVSMSCGETAARDNQAVLILSKHTIQAPGLLGCGP